MRMTPEAMLVRTVGVAWLLSEAVGALHVTVADVLPLSATAFTLAGQLMTGAWVSEVTGGGGGGGVVVMVVVVEEVMMVVWW